MKNQIQELRKLQGFSQEELAKRCSVTRQTINAIENDKYDPTLSLAFKLSRNLNTTVDQLFSFEEDKT
ncbi:helix-turn-helix transcriptional regulator [Planococcus salinus]|uniref:Transcriptional regulator n=1 Tax=Planococcus salinus TaxID=1848460 RepID=A0A3M8P6T4_9BACL|nr:helix-turn-helix transcriptional regulator [Planococcus salinus]RNF39375.1 transcriptional regulator [Planococcus salinus]